MRALTALALVLAPVAARAENLGLTAAIGAGAQGQATYGALELRLDAAWPGIRLGLGLRGVWDDGVFRREWARAADAVAIVRDFEVEREVAGGKLAVAAGRLAPAHIGALVDGYRAVLDDRWRTGVRGAMLSRDVELGLEIDDVLDPALIGGAVSWQLARPWGMHAAVAVDPTAPTMGGTRAATAIELGGGRRYETTGARADLGVSIVAELGLGVSAVGFGSAVAERDGVRWTARADVRAGTGTVGAMFGPLYRVERRAQGGLWDRARAGELDGVGAGATIGAANEVGWLELGARLRPGLGGLAIASAGAPMGRWLQAALWGAAGAHDGAGAAELRVAWARRLYSALQAARIYRFDAMEPAAVWSVTAWFGAASD